MNDDIPLSPRLGEDAEPTDRGDLRSALTQASSVAAGTVRGLSDAIEAGRQPGMPLSILSNIAREAPLGSLFVAFLMGIVIGRRRTT